MKDGTYTCGECSIAYRVIERLYCVHHTSCVHDTSIRKKIFADNTILYVENQKESTKKLLQLLHEFSKVTGYKINVHKLVAFLYTNNEASEKEMKESITFTVAPKTIRYLGINLTKELKDLYSENYRKFMKEIEEDAKKWKKKSMLMDWKNKCH